MTRAGICKHYNGYFHNTHCDVGVCYRDVTPNFDEPGSAYRLPCKKVDSPHGLQVLAETGPQGTCDKYIEPTQEEIAEVEAFIAKRMRQMTEVLPIVEAVKRDHKGQSWVGSVECPACHGKLHLSHSSVNGHVWGKCETDGCLAWME